MANTNHKPTQMISPIAIDLGAKNTGVYSAHYPAGCNLSDLSPSKIQGKVFEFGNYTPMLVDRTARRHARRNYKRNKMAKRLVCLILEHEFGISLTQHKVALGWLLNRRGFNRLEKAYSAEAITNLPEAVWDMLPAKTRRELDSKEAIPQVLENLESGQQEDARAKIDAIWQPIEPEVKSAKADLFYYQRLDKIQKALAEKGEGNIAEKDKGKIKISQIPRWVVQRAQKDGIQGLPSPGDLTPAHNMLAYLNGVDKSVLRQITDSLQAVNPSRHLEELKNNSFNLSSYESFDADEAEAAGKFHFDAAEEDEKKRATAKAQWHKTHLRNLCYAFYKIYSEITSGARHRKNYFAEIKNDWERMASHPVAHLRESFTVLQTAVDGKKATNSDVALDADKFLKLICHISNLELTPLREYFNNQTRARKADPKRQHGSKRGGDKWDPDILSNVFNKWILKLWRVSRANDGEQKVKDYKTLVGDDGKGGKWAEHKGDIVSFWLNECPTLTIPPYQNNNNRRPPHCQSLLLNPSWLTKHYSQWGAWLTSLRDALPDSKDISQFEARVAPSVCESWREKDPSGTRAKGKRGKSKDAIDRATKARVLQRVLDTARDSDPLRLNLIWSCHHKITQIKTNGEDNSGGLKKYEDKLAEHIRESKLPQNLKDEIKSGGEFMRFINAYYRDRQDTRRERFFLHQSKKNQWQDDKIFMICPHKPRQKKKQTLLDLAAIFGADADGLDKRITEHDASLDERTKQKPDYDKTVAWLSSFSLEKHAEKCAVAQKEHKGALKDEIEKAAASSALGKRDANSKTFALQIAKAIWSDLNWGELKPEHLTASKSKNNPTIAKAYRFCSVFSFAQIYNIAYKERAGFSKTCPVCSADNAERMRTDGGDGNALASRLPGLSMRLIDGTVMRICDKISTHIATGALQQIVKDLEDGNCVTVPIIPEQNSFSFEPTLDEIKGKGGKKDKKDVESIQHARKEERVKKNFNKDGAPYTGCPYCADKTALGGNGEIDHIIARASRFGTLNDEANLIYAHADCNKHLSNTRKSLQHLTDGYKSHQFGTVDADEIKEWIYLRLVGTGKDREANLSNQEFAFGSYGNFVNLSSEERVAFRHALFLEKEKNEDDPLRKMVVNAVDNRNRTIVNGTQRYLAQCIADKIYNKIPIKHRCRLKFDYFEYSPRDIKALREAYEHHCAAELGGYKKQKNKPQDAYSHLLDAQMAFLFACSEHRDNGTMRIIFDHGNDEDADANTSNHDEVVKHFTSYFNYTKIAPDNFQKIKLDRAKLITGDRRNRSYTRPNFYSEHYVPLLLGKEDGKIAIKAGFSWSNSVLVDTDKDMSNVFACLGLFAERSDIRELCAAQDAEHEDLQALYDILQPASSSKNARYHYIGWDRKEIHSYLVEHFSTRALSQGTGWTARVKFIRELSYRAQKVEVTESLGEIVEDSKNFTIKILNKSLTFPAKQEWQRLFVDWQQKKDSTSFDDFVKSHRLFKHAAAPKFEHQKRGKKFSLPVVTGEGHFIQKRATWDNDPIYQIYSDSDSRVDGNKFSRMVLTHEGELKETINTSFLSANKFKLTEESGLVFKDYENISPSEWYAVAIPQDLLPLVDSLSYKVADTSRVKIRLRPKFGISEEGVTAILVGTYTKPRIDKKSNESTEKYQEKVALFKERVVNASREQNLFEYPSATMSSGIMRLLRDALLSKSLQ